MNIPYRFLATVILVTLVYIGIMYAFGRVTTLAEAERVLLTYTTAALVARATGMSYASRSNKEGTDSPRPSVAGVVVDTVIILLAAFILVEDFPYTANRGGTAIAFGILCVYLFRIVLKIIALKRVQSHAVASPPSQSVSS